MATSTVMTLTRPKALIGRWLWLRSRRTADGRLPAIRRRHVRLLGSAPKVRFAFDLLVERHASSPSSPQGQYFARPAQGLPFGEREGLLCERARTRVRRERARQ